MASATGRIAGGRTRRDSPSIPFRPASASETSSRAENPFLGAVIYFTVSFQPVSPKVASNGPVP